MKRIINYLTENKLIVNIITFFIVLIGVITLIGLKQDLFPDASLDMMVVDVVYPGATPKDVEIDAVTQIEREIKKISGISDYTSISMDNGGRIFIEIDENVKNKQKVKDDIYRKLSNVPGIPVDVEDIIIKEFDPKLKEIYEFGIYKDENSSISDKELYAFADFLEDQLLKVNGVSDVRMSGYRDREIKIKVDNNKMDNYYISLTEIVNSINKRNVRYPGGTLTSKDGEYSVITEGEFESPLDVKDVIIRSNYNSNSVRINDIAEVEDGFKKENIKIKVNKNQGLTIEIVKKAEADIVKTVNNVKKYLKDNKNIFPEGILIAEIGDDSRTITSLLEIVRMNAIIGFILVFLILLSFLLDLRTAFWTAFGIPMTLFITFVFMRIFDFSINILSLGAIAMMLGILVDDSIVISESIYKELSKGLSPVKAAYTGLKKVAGPVIVSVLTTVVAFLPLFLIKGMMGKFIFVLPSIVILSLIASLFEAFFLLPAHLAHSKTGELKFKKKFNWFSKVEKFYEKSLKYILKYRYVVVSIFIGIFILAVFISRENIKGFVLIKDDSSDKIIIKTETPVGNSLDQTSKYIEEIEKIVLNEVKKSEILSLKTIIGNHDSSHMEYEGYHTNWAMVDVNLVPNSERKRNADEIIKALHKKINTRKLDNFTEIVIEKKVMGPDTGKPVNIQVIGNNDNEVNEVGRSITDYLGTINGVINIEDDRQNKKKEVVINFDYEKMGIYGINVETVAQTVRTAYEGTIATTIQTHDKDLDYRVILELPENKAKNKEYLNNLLIPNNRGQLIKLKEVAVISIKESYLAIKHDDGDRTLTVTADLNSKKLTSMKVTKMVNDKFKNISSVYPYVSIDIGGEAKESMSSLSDLGIAFFIALILIYLIIVVLFKNLTQPLLILLAIPFGIIGAIIGFTIHGMPLTFFGLVGIIGLSGVVVNDCIVMVDFINNEMKKKDKSNFINTIIKGAKERLRPVILTTLTTVVGLMPTIYGFGGSSPMITPVAIALGYGIMFATFLTLIFIPSIYCIRLDIVEVFNKIKLINNTKKKIKSKLEPVAEEV